MNSLVMTVLTEDKPGLVDTIASMIKEHGGNWLESRMSRLGGRFAGILRVDIPSEKQAEFLQACKKLESKGWTIVAHRDDSTPTSAESKEMILDIIGQDRPGIVQQISHALALSKVNIEDLHTETQSAPMSGETLFHARATIQIPPAVSAKQLQTSLEKIASDLMVELSLEDREASSTTNR
jgi:glycine cleavage system regulatory protein